MIATQTLKCSLPRAVADRLNQESGRIYTRVMVEHWRIYRKCGVWNDALDADRPNVLHAHSIDAAQQGFYKACTTIRALRKAGHTTARYPYKRKRFRTTIWKRTGIRLREGRLLLSLARGSDPLVVALPEGMAHLPESAYREARLVYNHKSRRYEWHVVVDDGQAPPPPPGENVVSVDLGEIHPAVATDPSQAVVFSARELRATIQYRNKKLAELGRLQSRCEKESRRWRRLQVRRNAIQGRCQRKVRDILHKVSRALVNWAVEREAGTIVIGDVRDAADGKRLARKSQQKVSQWTHGRLRRYITYKAERAGIRVVLADEAYTSQTCPVCGSRHKPRGREYCCPACAFSGHRDVVGAANILSRHANGHAGGIYPQDVRFVQPYKVSPSGHEASCLRFLKKPRQFIGGRVSLEQDRL